jgi:predicted dehydrogenase
MSSRRKFLQNSAAMVGGSLLLSAIDNKAFAIFKNRISPNDQLNIGAIGVNGMGWSDVTAALKIPGVNLVAICDIDKNVIASRLNDLTKMGKDASKVKTYGDYRQLLDNKDVDVVVIGTPDHWHALIMMDACAAGKDVYCEKPVGNSIGECRAMVAAQKRYNKAVQCGQWQRSQQHFKDAVDYVQSGVLGNIRTVKVWCYQGWMKPGLVVPDTPPPAGVDYAMWLGPAPMRPFNSSRFHFNFRWFWDYAGGLMTDWGVHLLDYGLLGMKSPTPKSIEALGGRFAYPDLYEETPDTLTTLYEFDGFNMVWDSALGIDNGSYNRDHGIAYIGNNGTLILNRGGWEVIEEKGSKNKVSKAFAPSVDNGVEKHWVNFVDVVKSRKFEDLNCPIKAGAHVATVAQMGNIAYRSGKKLEWDATKEQFTDDALNKEYFMKEYHNGYKLPTV